MANDEELEKKVQKLQGQVNNYLKKTQELKNEVKRKDEKNEHLSKELNQVND